jgi:hypothetical protein
MKKLLAIVAIAMLFVGAFAFVLNLNPVEAVTTYKYLTIGYSPGVMPVPSIAPAVGTHQYTLNSKINVTAPTIVNDTSDIRYVFDHWDWWREESNTTGTNTNNQITVTMDENKTVTASYKPQYKLTVDTGGYGTPKIYVTSWEAVSEKWVDANTNAWAGVFDLAGTILGTYGEYICPNQWAGFVNWTSGATGANVYGPYDGWKYWIQSNPINMTGPKNALAEWKFIYKLYVKKGIGLQPPLSDPPLGSQGWYEYCTYVNLTAPNPHPSWYSANHHRWVFDYWELDGVKQEPPSVNLTVHMDKNHTATVYYRLQVWLQLWDNVGNQTEIRDTGKWYNNCTSYTFSVPDTITLSGGVRYKFKKWVLTNTGNVGTTPTINLHCNYNTWAGEKLWAIYKVQYYLGLFSSGSEVPGFLYPDSDTSGWYDASSSVTIKAKPIVNIDATSRYSFIQWKNHLGGTNPNNNITFVLNQAWNLTAEYDLEYLATWDYSPTTITITGWPGQAWISNGTAVSYTAHGTDDSGNFAFYYWVINGVTYAQGQNPVNLGVMTGPIDGTAYYANRTKIFMDPSYHDETAHAWCNKFNVTIYATNFDAMRSVGGSPMDIYGFEIGIKWDASLIEVQDVYRHLDDFFAPHDWSKAYEDLDNSAGTYMLAASLKGNYSGFEGTKAIFTLTFHVIYDACYPNTDWTWIQFDPSHRKLVNHLEDPISPELGWKDCKYEMKTIKPMLEVRDATDGDNHIQVDTYTPGQTFFDVEVYLHDGVKVHDYFVRLRYNKDQIEARSVVITDYLKPPYAMFKWTIDNSVGKVEVTVIQQPSVPLQNCSGLLFTVRFEVVDSLYYTIVGPHYLKSDIWIAYAYLSVKCPTSFNQYTPTYLDTTKAEYVFNPLPGDLDLDGCVTVLDLQLVADNYLKLPVKYDITGDGKTDIFDFVFVALRFNTCI